MFVMQKIKANETNCKEGWEGVFIIYPINMLILYLGISSSITNYKFLYVIYIISTYLIRCLVQPTLKVLVFHEVYVQGYHVIYFFQVQIYSFEEQVQLQ